MKDISTSKTLTDFLENEKPLKLKNNRVQCNICNTNYVYNPGEGTRSLKAHLTTKKHLKLLQTQLCQSNVCSIVKTEIPVEEFDRELFVAFADANISLNRA